MEKQVSIDSLIKYQITDPWIGPENVTRLKKAIGVEGVLEPLVVRKAGRQYEILDGHHRWAVAKRLKLKTVPVRVVEADDLKASQLFYSLNENRKGKTADHYLTSWISRWKTLDDADELNGTRLENRRTVAESLQAQTENDKWLTGERDQIGEAAVLASIAYSHDIKAKTIGGRHVNGQDSALAIVRTYDRGVRQIEEAEKFKDITETKAETGLKLLRTTLVERSARDGHAADVTAALRAVVAKIVPEKKAEPDLAKPLVDQCSRIRKWLEASDKRLEELDRDLGPAIQFAPQDARRTAEIHSVIDEAERFEKQLRKFIDRVQNALEPAKKATRLKSVR
jgi:hypothetical protein